MRDFSWKYFSNSGDIDAYLLYKEIHADRERTEREKDEAASEEDREER
jgi:hypothetical protein